MDKRSLFDTSDPDNQLGPVVIAIIVTLVVGILGVLTASVHHY